MPHRSDAPQPNRLQDVAPMPIEEFIATPRNQTRARPLQAGGP